MMKRLGLMSFALALLGASAPSVSAPADAAGTPTSTQRYVHGVVTAVSAQRMTISTERGAVSGSIDPSRTKVTLHGRPAKVTDLPPSVHAKAELCLDDVWLTIDAHEVH